VASGSFLYGTTDSGGKSFSGTIFQIDPANEKTTTLYSFAGYNDGIHPQGALTISGGQIYGTTAAGGGTSGTGTVYAFDPATGAKTTHVLRGSIDGEYPAGGLTEAAGRFYGTAGGGGALGYGTVFTFDPKTGAVAPLYAFAGGNDGANPSGSLLALGGRLYGVTSGGGGSANAGTVFVIDPSGTETVLYRFVKNESGYAPQANLIALNGALYGTTGGGGKYGYGTVFAISPVTGRERTLYSFTGGSDGGLPTGAVTTVNGKLYGTTSISNTTTNPPGGGTVYEIDLSTGVEANLYDFGVVGGTCPNGCAPFAGLVQSGSKLFGTAAAGGADNGGTVFSIDTQSANFAVVHSFVGKANANYNSGLVNVNGALLGTSSSAGTQGNGTIFQVGHRIGGGETAYAFADGLDGTTPLGGLLNAWKTLYGTTSGRTGVPGVLFSFDPANKTKANVYAFSAAREGAPAAPIIDVGGVLYGTTYDGFGYGTIFGYNIATGTEQTLHIFLNGPDGAYPRAGLVAVGQTLYGTTNGLPPGESPNMPGTIFGITLNTEGPQTTYTYKSYYTFDTTHGANPGGAMVHLGNLLYGTATYGGTYGPGTVFSFNPVTGKITTVYSFTGLADGGMPQSGLTVFRGKLIGTASGGGAHNAGTVFQIDPVTHTETTLYAFTAGLDGGFPTAPLLTLNGVLYGTTSAGGAGGRGTVFSLQP
jgi:uncharacterized repeat protein (TIGR03803 family)